MQLMHSALHHVNPRWLCSRQPTHPNVLAAIICLGCLGANDDAATTAIAKAGGVELIVSMLDSECQLNKESVQMAALHALYKLAQGVGTGALETT
eukprot:SAG11_NODE_44_length_20765_cov_5.183635_14_plen_95_part_00